MCFATILVAATVLLGSIQFTNTASAGATVTKEYVPLHNGNPLVDNPIIDNQYTFSVTVTGQTTATGQLYVSIAKSGIEASNVDLAWWDATLNEDAGGWAPLTASDTGDILSYTFPTTTALTPSSTNTYEFQIEYNVIGTYEVTAYVNLV